MNVENSVVDDFDNSSSLVKLAIAILDDPNGISEEAFSALKIVFENATVVVSSVFETDILPMVKCCEGRVYLPEDWNEIQSVEIPVIGKLKENGQVEFFKESK